MATTIYALAHPETDEVRYIGKTIQRLLCVRLSGHICDARAHRYECAKNYWIRSLLDQNLKPTIKPLMIVPDEHFAYFEVATIALFKRLYGKRILNHTEGGEGATGRVYSHSAATKEKLRIASTGFRHSAETRAKMCEVQKALVTPESRLAVSQRMTGMTHSAAARAKMSEDRRGKTSSDETKEKLRQAQQLRRQREAADGTLIELGKKMGRIKQGTVHTAETKEKMRQSALRRWSYRCLIS